MLSDCRHPRFRNLNSIVPVDVVRLKSYVDSLLNSMRVPAMVSVNKLDNARSYWRVQKRPKFEFVKTVYSYRAP